MITELGDTIYVYQNGTWSFDLEDREYKQTFNDMLSYDVNIDTILAPQKFSNNTNKSISTIIDQFDFKYDDNNWKRVPPEKYNEEAEFAFENKKNDRNYCL